MPSFLIVNSAALAARSASFAQPPTLDVDGMHALLDWGDVTVEVPVGEHRVAIFVDYPDGSRDGAVLPVAVAPGVGIRISFVPPQGPGVPATVQVHGQWPADASMAYYAARDGRVLTRPAQPIAQVAPQQPAAPATFVGQQPEHQAPQQPQRPQQQPQPYQQPQQQAFQAPQQPQQASRPPVQPQPEVRQQAQPPQQQAFQPPQQQPPFQAPQQLRPARDPRPSVPPVGPSVGSTGEVPQTRPATPGAPSFGQMQGSVVEPTQPGRQQQPGSRPQQAPPMHGAPPHPGFGQQQPGQQHPGFGQQPQPAVVRHDIYGRARVDGDKSAPAIPTPQEFDGYNQARASSGQQAGQQSGQPQGWYPDPHRRADLRWFDGSTWTPSVMRAGQRGTDRI